MTGKHEQVKLFGNVIWLYGMSGAGKTTLGTRLAKDLNYMFIDSDYFRQVRWIKPDFTPKGRRKYQNELRNEVARLQLSFSPGIVVASITPYTDMREKNRRVFGKEYLEVLLKCDIDTLIQRDPKGLYKRAMEGDLFNFTGLTDSFEEGEPHLIVYTNDGEDLSYKILLENVRKWLNV